MDKEIMHLYEQAYALEPNLAFILIKTSKSKQKILYYKFDNKRIQQYWFDTNTNKSTNLTVAQERLMYGTHQCHGQFYIKLFPEMKFQIKGNQVFYKESVLLAIHLSNSDHVRILTENQNSIVGFHINSVVA